MQYGKTNTPVAGPFLYSVGKLFHLVFQHKRQLTQGYALGEDERMWSVSFLFLNCI